MSKHSPGPWRWSPRTHGETLCDADGNTIARLITGVDATTDPDARLVAKAPELLEALEEAMCQLTDRDPEGCQRWRALIREIDGE